MKAPQRRIILTGFMCAGKTSVGEALARRLDCRFVDLDEHVAASEGRSVAAIIEEDGEGAFRDLETRALGEALDAYDARIIALGGGTWTLERNRSLLASHHCLVVWLDVPFDLCWQRIIRSGDARPLARDEVQARTLYEERRELYGLGGLRIKVEEEKEADDLAAEIINVTKGDRVDQY